MKFLVRPHPMIRTPWRLELMLLNGDKLVMLVEGSSVNVARTLAEHLNTVVSSVDVESKRST